MKPLIALLVVCLASLAQQPALDFKELAEDTKLTSASGATFTVAKGWHVARADGLIVIQEPQRELAAAFAEVTAASRYPHSPRATTAAQCDRRRSTTSRPSMNRGPS